MSNCGGCPPWYPCTGVAPMASYSDDDQDDETSWVVQQNDNPMTGGPFVHFQQGFSVSSPNDVPGHMDQDFAQLNTVMFYSVPIPPGAITARLHGTVRSQGGSTSGQAPDLFDVPWEILRGSWGLSAPSGVNPGGAVLASGALDFTAAGGVDPFPGPFDTGLFSIAGAYFQFYLHFVTPPDDGSGFYRLRLENNPVLGDTWALEFYDCQLRPIASQSIENEFIAFGDGVTTSYATAHPFLPGTLSVDVSAITSPLGALVPETGAFDLEDPAPMGAPIFASYRGSGA